MKYQSVIARNEAIPAQANKRGTIIEKGHFNYICPLDWDSSEIASFLTITSRIRKFKTLIEKPNALLVFGRDKILRLLTVFLCLFYITNGASAQDTSRNKTDPLHINYNRDPLSNPKYYNNPPLYIIDDKLIEDSLSNNLINNINPADILEITVLRDSSIRGFEKRRDVIRITTKIYAQKQYQNKLSSFSKKYKTYLQTHQNNDIGIFYILNGIPLNGTPMTTKVSEDVTKKLYGIPYKNIKTVGYSDNFLEGMKSGAFIIIETKQ